jgi:hypothetical protein
MKRLTVFIFILIAYSVSAQQNFASKEYNFRISFPKEWDVSTKNSKYAVEAYEDEYTGVSISVTNYPELPDSLDIGYIHKDTLKKVIESQFNYVFKKSLIISSGIGIMDGILAYFYFVQYADYKDGVPTKFISFQYQFIYRKKFYSIFGICPLKRYDNYEKEFNKIYSTFRFISKK